MPDPTVPEPTSSDDTAPNEWDGETDECTACGTGVAEFLDPRPRHPSEPQAQYCRECAADKFDIGEEWS